MACLHRLRRLGRAGEGQHLGVDHVGPVGGPLAQRVGVHHAGDLVAALADEDADAGRAGQCRLTPRRGRGLALAEQVEHGPRRRRRTQQRVVGRHAVEPLALGQGQRLELGRDRRHR